jgi:hypothetical protein
LKKGKVGQLVGLGAFFWLVAALFIRFTGDRVFRKGSPLLALLYVLSWPIAYVIVKTGTRAAAVEKEDMVDSVAVMSLTAMILDGVALTWFKGFYGEEFENTHYGAAWLLYGVGVCFLVAFSLRSRDRGV